MLNSSRWEVYHSIVAIIITPRVCRHNKIISRTCHHLFSGVKGVFIVKLHELKSGRLKEMLRVFRNFGRLNEIKTDTCELLK